MVRAFTAHFPAPIADIRSTPITALLTRDAVVPVAVVPSSDPLRSAVRDLLRHGGFKPTGRSKPASEYLIKASEAGFLGSINAAVDACNAVSLHSGFPISVVDRDRTASDGQGLRIAIAKDHPESDASYVFNASGQTIDIDGLLCLFDAVGPCANAVKDAQRTKTDAGTTRTLSVLWGVRGHEPALDAATAWYRDLLVSIGAIVEDVVLVLPPNGPNEAPFAP